ncbi:hypothetical protein RGP45_004284 [Aeromonas hydrophila]|nr:hypothetical protein [Aeromonas hydrophila]
MKFRTIPKKPASKASCLSCSVDAHEKLVGAFIERHHFNQLESSPICGCHTSFSSEGL